MGAIAPPLKLRRGDRKRLEQLVKRGTTEYRTVQRAQIVLLANEAESNCAIARKTGTHRNQVIQWRKRYEEKGIGGLEDRERSGRPKEISAKQIHRVVNTVWPQTTAGAFSLERADVGQKGAYFSIQRPAYPAGK